MLQALLVLFRQCVANELLKMRRDLLSIVGLGVVLEALLGVSDSPQVCIPVVKLDHIPEENQTAVAVIGTYTFDLIGEELPVEVNDLVFQFVSHSRELVSVVGEILQKVARQAPVPAHPLDNVVDPFTVGFGRLYGVGKQLQKSACGTSPSQINAPLE